jgi:transposase-like protein
MAFSRADAARNRPHLTPGASDEATPTPGTIPLTDAARELDLDPAVLRRWLRREGIGMLTHPTDHRRRMIRMDDFERLARQRESTLAPTSAASEGAAPVLAESIGQQLDAVRSTLSKTNDATNTHLAALLNNIVELNDRIARLEQRLERSKSEERV